MTESTPGAPLPLQGVTVLMVGGSVAYCGRLLSGLGATVVLVEPPQGVPERRFPPFAPGPLGARSSLSFAFCAAGMRSVCLDSTTQDGADVLRRAFGAADVCVDALPWEARSAWVESVQEALSRVEGVPVCVMGPDGALAGIGADDLLVQAASGHLYVSGFAEGEPTPIPMDMGKAQTALLGASAVLATLFTDEGRPKSVNVRAQAALALTTLQTSNPGFLKWRGTVPKRAGREGIGGAPYPCKDGWVSFTVPGERWGVFIAWLDELGIERGTLPTVLDGQVESMRAALAQARGSVEELAQRFTKRELYHAAQGRGILCMPMNTMGEVLADEHLKARGFFIEDSSGTTDLVAPFRSKPELWRLVQEAPALGGFTEEFCSNSLGYSRPEIEALVAMGAIACGH